MRKISCLPRRGLRLCRECGTNIDTEQVPFSSEEKNLVYMDKVYSYSQTTSCPLLSVFTSNPGNSVTELKLEGMIDHDQCGCSGRGCPQCRPDHCALGPDAVFDIDDSYVLVKSFTLAKPESLKSEQITVNGLFADTISFSNGQFTATTNSILPEILKERCQDLNLPTKAYFLIVDAGPWVYRATFVLKGTVNTNGRTCRFQAKIKTACSPRSVNGVSNFAVPHISLPCSVNGTAPVINFQFSGAVSMLNPELSFTPCGAGLVLETTLVIEPSLNAEVVRRSLFCVDACEGLPPCDGTEQKYETEIEDCEWPPKPACGCGTASLPSVYPMLTHHKKTHILDDGIVYSCRNESPVSSCGNDCDSVWNNHYDNDCALGMTSHYCNEYGVGFNNRYGNYDNCRNGHNGFYW